MGNLRGLKTSKGGGGGSGTIVLDKDFPVVLSGGKTFGRYANGTTIPAIGKTLNQFLDDVTTEYLLPTFASFAISGLGSTLEIGSDVLGNRTATWTTTNPANISANSIFIFNTTGSNVTLAGGLANDGTEAVVVASGIITASGWTFTISATNTELPVPSTFQRPYTINGRYRYFYGVSATIPIDSAGVRALPVITQFSIPSGADSITLNTGNTLLNFIFGIPASKTLVSIIDLDAANANLTSSYILATFNVNDANGVGVPYKIYSLTIAVPYSSNHRHQITLS